MEKYLKKLKQMRFLKKIYMGYYNFIRNNADVEKIIYLQHKKLPMPLFLFDLLYRSKIGILIFGVYGWHCFESSYCARENHLSYWMSKESLYWHLLQ